MDRITLAEQSAAIERHKAKRGLTGTDYVPVNSGTSRTDSKRALLRAIGDAAASRRREPVFPQISPGTGDRVGSEALEAD
jgi:hypothetical protein